MCSSTDEVTSSGAYAEMQANLPEGCKLTTIDEVLAAGRAAGARPKMVIPGKDGQPEDPLINLMYTSGSSGRPKGAEYHEHLSVAFLKVRIWDCANYLHLYAGASEGPSKALCFLWVLHGSFRIQSDVIIADKHRTLQSMRLRAPVSSQAVGAYIGAFVASEYPRTATSGAA